MQERKLKGGHGTDLVGKVHEGVAVTAKRCLAGEGAEGLGQAGAQATLGEGVFEKIVGGGGMGKIGVAQAV